MIRMLGTLVFGLLFAGPAVAQTSTVSWTVVDQTGGAVPGATVRLAGAGGVLPTTSGPAGQYTFQNVAAGTMRSPSRFRASRPPSSVRACSKCG